MNYENVKILSLFFHWRPSFDSYYLWNGKGFMHIMVNWVYGNSKLPSLNDCSHSLIYSYEWVRKKEIFKLSSYSKGN